MIKRGLTLVAVMHITASVFINDDEYGLHQDYEKWLEELAPHAPISQYRHNDTGEDACPERSDRNADAHLKRQIMGREVVVAVTNGRLDSGTWERIFWVRWIADTGILTAGVGSACWSRLAGNRGAQTYPDINGRRSLCLT